LAKLSYGRLPLQLHHKKEFKKKRKRRITGPYLTQIFVDFLYSMSAYTDELFQDESHHPPTDG
jgi:hypothetical protein